MLFFCFYERTSKDERVLKFSSVPVALGIKDHAGLESYAKIIAERDGVKFESIARSKIYTEQLVEINGTKLLITGAKKVRCGEQLAYSQQETTIINRVLSAQETTDKELESLFNLLVDRIEIHANRLYDNLKLATRSESFSSISIEEKNNVIKGLLALSSAKSNKVDLRPIGGNQFSGTLTCPFEKELNSNGITFIDQSVTGMFERRTYIGL